MAKHKANHTVNHSAGNSALGRTIPAAFVVGFIFALGLGISGMTQPQKVIAFLDITGAWDPSLIFVMGGALIVHFFTYKIIRKRPSPLFDTKWHVPTKSDITPQLILGSMLFGIGWGLGGFCPGPGLTSLGSGSIKAVVYVATLLIGMLAYRAIEKKIPWAK